MIALTLGCPRGIGAEIVQKAVKALNGKYRFRLFGDPELTHAGLTPAEAGRLSFSYLEEATTAVMNGECSALVTAPINKGHWNTAGVEFTGHTEYLAARTGTQNPVMMLANDKLKVSLATIHIRLADVARSLTQDKIISAVTRTDEFLKVVHGIAKPRIAVTSLNPHIGDGGFLGNEESLVITPAIARLNESGILASGPFSADSIFAVTLEGKYDAVVAMYHDQGLAPVKTIDLKRTVNITLGLPIVRTSPDHGTAENIAGKGIADPSSLITAIEMAAWIVSKRVTNNYSPPL